MNENKENLCIIDNTRGSCFKRKDWPSTCSTIVVFSFPAIPVEYQNKFDKIGIKYKKIITKNFNLEEKEVTTSLLEYLKTFVFKKTSYITFLTLSQDQAFTVGWKKFLEDNFDFKLCLSWGNPLHSHKHCYLMVRKSGMLNEFDDYGEGLTFYAPQISKENLSISQLVTERNE